MGGGDAYFFQDEAKERFFAVKLRGRSRATRGWTARGG
jgi:hypothetical protein